VTDAGLTQVDGINPGDVLANSSFDKLQENTAVAISNNQKQGSNNSPNNTSDNKSQNNSKQPAPSAHKGSKAP
jgi:hypothetical protein